MQFNYSVKEANHQVVLFEDSTFVELVVYNDSNFKHLGFWEGGTSNEETLTLTITRKDFNVLSNIATQQFLIKGTKLIPLDSLDSFEPLQDRTIYDKRETSRK